MIYEILRYNIVNGEQHERLLLDGRDLIEVIESAEKYLEEQCARDGEYGSFEETYILRITDDADNEFEREIVLKLEVERSTLEADRRHWRDRSIYA